MSVHGPQRRAQVTGPTPSTAVENAAPAQQAAATQSVPALSPASQQSSTYTAAREAPAGTPSASSQEEAQLAHLRRRLAPRESGATARAEERARALAAGTEEVAVGMLDAAGQVVEAVVTGAVANAEGRPFHADAAESKKRPAPEQVTQLMATLQSGDHQNAIDKTVEDYGIDLAHVKDGKLSFDPAMEGHFEIGEDCSVRIGASAFEVSAPAELAARLLVATTRANQIALHGPARTAQDKAAYAAMVYLSVYNQADKLGLSSEAKEEYRQSYEQFYYYVRLEPENRARFDSGQYWGHEREPVGEDGSKEYREQRAKEKEEGGVGEVIRSIKRFLGIGRLRI